MTQTKVPNWKRYAFVREGRYVMPVEVALNHCPFDDVTLIYKRDPLNLQPFVVTGATDIGGGSYMLHQLGQDWEVAEGTLLEVVNHDLTRMRMKIYDTAEWVMEFNGFYEGGRVVCYDDDREVDDRVVPVGTEGTIAVMDRNGILTVQWDNGVLEDGVDPEIVEPAEDYPYNPPEYDVISTVAEKREKLLEQLMFKVEAARHHFQEMGRPTKYAVYGDDGDIGSRIADYDAAVNAMDAASRLVTEILRAEKDDG